MPIVLAVWLGWLGVMGLVGRKLDGNGTPSSDTCLVKDSGNVCIAWEKVPHNLNEK